MNTKSHLFTCSASKTRPEIPMEIILANPRGFCAGVNMAITCLEEAVRLFGSGIYVYHEIVHNQYVVNRFTKEGVSFVNDLKEVPEGSILLFSAHGVSPEIRSLAKERRLKSIDATCPLVTKVHLEALKYARENYNIILVGHEGHDEVIGTMGEAPESITLVETAEDVEKLPFTTEERLAYLTQTTLSVQEATEVITALKNRYPQIVSPPKEDICYATTNRQDAVHQLVTQADILLVLGSQNSSNSQRLKEIGSTHGIPAYLIDGEADLKDEWFKDSSRVLITAGASAPEVVVQDCVEHLRKKFNAQIKEVTLQEEKVQFPLPKSLRVLQNTI
ncbi:4-hydroxy-3-methylbut-2-enyl diphosphate reductase [Polystyrenella longa]|uniref:4-hydroxy-3-methylbut-2-enyl diphosphate reductase n=2 Tax=Polystyrenella longa TaxID=2528007 RepID=A0A518CQX1_9PLAN|nr:4-hydroxy-3-methylbut-2-enyl diphosphate reductase [Polystyrenella longa]QDU81610.1 4-hydroxy-3-methylbut-2-enyl diphosphate reductase [Polystyrenella longa]